MCAAATTDRTVLHVITDLDVGGAERMLVNYACERRNDGVRTVVASLKTPGIMAEPLRACGIEVHDLGIDAVSVGRVFQLIRAIWRLSGLVRYRRPEAIVGWMYHANLVALFATALSGGRGSMRLYAGIRCSEMRPHEEPLALRLTVLLSRWCAGRFDAVIFNSHAGRTEHEAMGFACRRTEVAGNGIDTNRFKPDPVARARIRAELGIAADRPVLVLSAAVRRMKDHPRFLEAFRALEGRADAVLAGRGTDDEGAIPPMPGLHRLGIRTDMPAVYAAADFIVMSSAYGEGFPNVVGEGMACGLIPIVTDIGDAATIAGDIGSVIPPEDPAALARALLRALDMPTTERRSKSDAARRRVTDKFSMSTACRRMDEAIGLAAPPV